MEADAQDLALRGRRAVEERLAASMEESLEVLH